MNKKGFVLMETLVVTIFTLFIFTILYNSVVPLLGKYKELSYYDDLDTTYDLYHISNLIKNDPSYENLLTNNYKMINCNNGSLTDKDACYDLFNFLEIDSTMDEVIYLKMSAKEELLNDSNVSKDVKNYLDYFEATGSILILQNDGLLSYLNLPKSDSLVTNMQFSIEEATCNPTIVEDGVTYLSGSNDCINFNYVWYSGKLWRITAINSDGTMKMITENLLTALNYGNGRIYYTNETNKSYMYQWLNEDFLDTLYNYQNIIVTDNLWNATNSNSTSEDEISVKLSETTMVKASVGLLNSYEYYLTYKNNGAPRTSYLFKDYDWWLLNLYDSSNYWVIDSGLPQAQSTFNGSVRPSVVLKNNLKILSGTGLKNDPYIIKGDKEINLSNTTLLNTRTSGEYVSFDNELYRIVSIENKMTKLTKVDYIRDEDGIIIKKSIASTSYYGDATNTQSDDYWDYYLNNTWYNSISSNYKNMLVKGVYYLGNVYSDNIVYKDAICSDGVNTITTKDCEKTTKTWTGYVGLLRFGEMFSSQLGDGYSDSSYMWLITPWNVTKIFELSSFGNYDGESLTAEMTVRPTIHLNSEVVIKSGSGTYQDPFEVGLSS